MEHINEKLRLEKGGHLFLHYNEYDKETDLVLKIKEIDDVVPASYLHGLRFEMGENVTMEDVFVFLKKDLSYWELILGNCVREYTEQSFEPYEDEQASDKDYHFDRLYCFWMMGCDKMNGEKTAQFPFPCFSGEGLSDGHVVSFGFGNIHMSVLNKVPIEIRHDLNIEYQNYDRKFKSGFEKGDGFDDFIEKINHRSLLERIFPFYRKWKYNLEMLISYKKYNFGKMDMTLFQFLYGIFYELSFYGKPSDRNSFFQKLNDRIEDFEDSKNL